MKASAGLPQPSHAMRPRHAEQRQRLAPWRSTSWGDLQTGGSKCWRSHAVLEQQGAAPSRRPASGLPSTACRAAQAPRMGHRHGHVALLGLLCACSAVTGQLGMWCAARGMHGMNTATSLCARRGPPLGLMQVVGSMSKRRPLRDDLASLMLNKRLVLVVVHAYWPRNPRSTWCSISLSLSLFACEARASCFGSASASMPNLNRDMLPFSCTFSHTPCKRKSMSAGHPGAGLAMALHRDWPIRPGAFPLACPHKH